MTPDEMRRAAAILENTSERHLKYYAEGQDLAAKLRALAEATEKPLPPPPQTTEVTP